VRIVNISGQQFDTFAIKHKYHSYYQTSSYGTLMSNHGFTPMYLGFYENNDLIGASLILYKSSFMGFKYGYAPRGLLIDYENYDEVMKITKHLKNYLFKEKFILLKMDPLILSTTRDKDGKILTTNEYKTNILNCLKSAGYYYCGQSTSFESVKPRWFALLDLNQEENELFKSLDKNIKNKIRKAMKYGIEIYKDNSKLEDIYPFIEKKGNYSLGYYKDLFNSFNNNVELYIAKINTETFVDGSTQCYEEEQKRNSYLHHIISQNGYKGKNIKDVLEQKMESDKLLNIYKEYLLTSTELLQKYPDGIIIAGTIVIKNNDNITLLIDGYNKQFGKLCPLYLARWEIIKKHLNTDYKYFNMNAVTGNFEKDDKHKNLNSLKFGYKTIAHEYLGEFNLIINNPLYSLYRSIVIEDSLKDIKK